MKIRTVMLIFAAACLTGCTGPVVESFDSTAEAAATEISSAEMTQPETTAPMADMVEIYIMPTEKGGTWEYLSPDQEIQETLISMLNRQENRQQLDEVIWEEREEYGFGFSYQEYRYEIWNNNTIVAHPDVYENEHFLFENQELCEAVKEYVRQASGMEIFSPTEIEAIVSAELIYKDYENGTVICSVQLDDREKIALLEGWMKQAVIINGGSGCGFNECELKLERADGEIFTLAMAGDGCSTYFVNGRYFQCQSIDSNEPFYDLFKEHPIIRAWRTENPESVSEGVVMTVVDGSVTPDSISLCLYNGTSLNITYGNGYHLEKKENDAWERLPYLIDNWAVTSIGYDLKWKKPQEFAVDWTTPYGTLETGEYRIIKDVQDFRGAGDYDSYELSVEFSIPAIDNR